MSREALVLLVCCCDFRDGAERLIPSKSLRNAVIRAFPGLFRILRMCAPRRAAAVVRPRGREKSADRRRRILISRLLIIRASVPRRKSPFPAYFKGFPAVSPLIPPYPAFLKYPVSPHWQQLIDEREAAGRSQSTINNVSILIKALCSYAMERDILGKDYSRYLDVPSVDPKKPRGALTDIQLKNLEKLAAAGEPWADTALILCYTGFRITEFLTLTRFSFHPEDGGYLQGGIKSDAGRNRIVPIHPKIRPYVDRWLARNGDTIFCDDDGAHLPAARYREYFAVIMAKIDAPQATPHWCRHTFSTNLHAAGVDEITIKWLMGHSTRSDITAHYTHETIAVLRAAVRKVA